MGQGEDGGEIKDLPRKLITATLLKHKEKEVRLYAALCLSDVLRIFAPEDPYQDDLVLKGVYVAFLDALAHLKDPSKSAFECAHALLQNIAAHGSAGELRGKIRGANESLLDGARVDVRPCFEPGERH